MKRLDLLVIALTVFGVWSLVNSHEIFKTTEFVSLQSNSVVVGACSGGTASWSGSACQGTVITVYEQKYAPIAGYQLPAGCKTVLQYPCGPEDQYTISGTEGTSTINNSNCVGTFWAPNPSDDPLLVWEDVEIIINGMPIVTEQCICIPPPLSIHPQSCGSKLVVNGC
jgi:hypothetical protein